MTATSTRREFLKTGAVAGGTLLLGFHLPLAAAKANTETTAAFAPNAFIRIDKQGTVTLIIPQVEMGQGIYTGLSMILAEELDASWDKVRVEHAPPNEKLYANPVFFIQATGGSTSVRAFWKPLRVAGASPRVPCWWERRRNAGELPRRPAIAPTVRSLISRADAHSPMRPWWRRPAGSRLPTRRRSKTSRILRSSASP